MVGFTDGLNAEVVVGYVIRLGTDRADSTGAPVAINRNAVAVSIGTKKTNVRPPNHLSHGFDA